MILRLATVIGALIMVTQSFAQETADTIFVTPKASEITVIEKDDGITIKIEGYNDLKDSEFIYRASSEESTSSFISFNDITTLFGRKKNDSNYHKWSAILNGLYLGFNNGMDTEMDIDLGRSTEFGILNLVAAEYRPWISGPMFSLGVGFGWKNYVTKKGRNRFYKSDEGYLISAPYPDVSLGFRSTLRIFHLDVPFIIKQMIDNHWAISVGGIVNFNLDARASSRYRILGSNSQGRIQEGKSVTEKYNHLQQRRVTTELLMALGYSEAFSVYVKYSPMSVMKKGEGPHLESWSFGVMFPF